MIFTFRYYELWKVKDRLHLMKKIIFLISFLIFSSLTFSCVGIRFMQYNEIEMVTHHSPNFNDRKQQISMIVLHYTVIPTCEESLQRLSDANGPFGPVSAHYLVDRDGTIYKLVDEEYRAWHAGAGAWKGLKDINSRSIGIEIVNKGVSEEGIGEPFPERQIDAVIKLCKDIQSRHKIKYIVGHSDIAPQRKSDPGEFFPWKKLASEGIGVWSDKFDNLDKNIYEMLEKIGYDISNKEAAIVAFQRHWYPEAITRLETNTCGRIAAIYNLLDNEDN